ncbi:50S ribosomal protein L31 [Candidatus Microgenomates bacterium]|nr:50S ribosomal protein L31 [Candidatus Microgenomates bacterium]
MKKDVHPQWKETTVTCNSCNTTLKTHSTVESITVEICSNCHPFYTGKQKLVDTAGRVDKFRARQAAAHTKPSQKPAKTTVSTKPAKTLKDLKQSVSSDQ